jgi:RND family efflux transporter MFP subunit
MKNSSHNLRRWWKVIAVSCIAIIIVIGSLWGWYSTEDVLSHSAISVGSRPSQNYAETDTVHYEQYGATLSARGTIEARADVAIMSETSGRLLHVNVRIGDYVRKGTVIARVNDVLKQAAIASVRVQVDKIERDLLRGEALYKEGNIALTELESLRLQYAAVQAQFAAAEYDLATCLIRVPFDGKVTAVHVHHGSVIAPGTPIITLMDDSETMVIARIPESDISMLQEGMKVKVSTTAVPHELYEGVITMTGTRADANRVFAVHISLPRHCPLKPGQSANVHYIASATQVLSVPSNCIVSASGGAKYVLVVDAARTVHRRAIVLGKTLPSSRVVIDQGLKAGDIIVVNGTHTLKAGDVIQTH